MEKTNVVYDYIFSGLGLSACHVLIELASQGLLYEKQVLILDYKENHIEKSWCFWEKGIGKWDDLLSKSWKKGAFISDETTMECLSENLTYKYVASEDFISHTLGMLSEFPLIEILNTKMVSWTDQGDKVTVVTAAGEFSTKTFFNSVFTPAGSSDKFPLLLQHFTGWFIESNQLPFSADSITLMDFSVEQKNNTRFMYVLPFTNTSALVEYTLFSTELLDASEYENEIRAYLKPKGINEFTIAKRETGIIPMTSEPFWKANTKNVLHIGTAGGWTKPSTGYTFARAEKLAKKLAGFLSHQSRDFTKFHQANRFDFYDRIFIQVLFHENQLGKQIFTDIFRKAGPDKLLSFMKEETSLFEELQIIWACPKIPFIKAFFQSLSQSKLF